MSNEIADWPDAYIAKNATKSDVDEMDEICALRALERLAESDNVMGLMRIRSKLENIIKDAQLRVAARHASKFTKKLNGPIKAVVKASSFLKKGLF